MIPNILRAANNFMSNQAKAVTIQDVAKAAGVSVSTISRVLNQKDDVATDTQDRIRAVIDQLGYTSNIAARSMRSRKLNMIGLIVPDLEGPYSFEILKGVNRAIANREYDLLVYTTGDFKKNDTAAHEQHYVSLINGTITDGVLVVTPSFCEFSTKAPLVSIDPNIPNPSHPAILATNYLGAVEAMNYLINLGHRRIAFITGRIGLQTNDRLRAYKDCLEKYQIPFDPELVVEGDFSTGSGIIAGRNLLQLENRPSAIFAANDQTAIGVLQSAKEMGVRVPQDLSIIGFDNISEAEYFELTTVDQSLVEMGTTAAEMLIDLINNKTVDPKVVTIPTRLVIRKSCMEYQVK